jgi:hypothetical protein
MTLDRPVPEISSVGPIPTVPRLTRSPGVLHTPGEGTTQAPVLGTTRGTGGNGWERLAEEDAKEAPAPLSRDEPEIPRLAALAAEAGALARGGAVRLDRGAVRLTLRPCGLSPHRPGLVCRTQTYTRRATRAKREACGVCFQSVRSSEARLSASDANAEAA